MRTESDASQWLKHVSFSAKSVGCAAARPGSLRIASTLVPAFTFALDYFLRNRVANGYNRPPGGDS